MSLVKDHTDGSKSDFVSTLYNSLISLAVVTIGILILQVGIDIVKLELHWSDFFIAAFFLFSFFFTHNFSFSRHHAVLYARE